MITRLNTLTITAAISFAGLLALPASGFSSHSDCGAMAADIEAERARILKLESEREDLLVDVETAGDEWEAAAATKNFSEAEAANADTAKSEYDSLKAELMKLERNLQDRVSTLNAEVASYNSNCARD